MLKYANKKNIKLLDKMEENVKHFDEATPELKAKKFEEVNGIISETSNELEIDREDMRNQLDMIRGLI